jgi:hypothetical protein
MLRSGDCLAADRPPPARPRGILTGGGPAAPGLNLLLRDGTETELPDKATLEARKHDIMPVQTPGVGTWGTKCLSEDTWRTQTDRSLPASMRMPSGAASTTMCWRGVFRPPAGLSPVKSRGLYLRAISFNRALKGHRPVSNTQGLSKVHVDIHAARRPPLDGAAMQPPDGQWPGGGGALQHPARHQPVLVGE